MIDHKPVRARLVEREPGGDEWQARRYEIIAGDAALTNKSLKLFVLHVSQAASLSELNSTQGVSSSLRPSPTVRFHSKSGSSVEVELFRAAALSSSSRARDRNENRGPGGRNKMYGVWASRARLASKKLKLR